MKENISDVLAQFASRMNSGGLVKLLLISWGKLTRSFSPVLIAAFMVTVLLVLAPQAVNCQTVHFEKNEGQFDSRVRFKAQNTNGVSTFLQRTGAVHVIYGDTGGHRVNDPKTATTATAVYLSFDGANQNSNIFGSDLLPHRTNHFSGTDPENWHVNVPNYGMVTMQDLYPGIAAIWFDHDHGNPEFSFVLKPGTEPYIIELMIDGARDVNINGLGDLEIETDSGVLLQRLPDFYIENSDRTLSFIEQDFGYRILPVASLDSPPGAFRVKLESSSAAGSRQRSLLSFRHGYLGAESGILTESLNNLAYSTFLGGSAAETFPYLGMTVDSGGYAYVTGQSSSLNFPSTPGSFDPTNEFQGAAFVSKLNTDGSGLEFSTFLHGRTPALGTDVAVDPAGNVLVTGCTGGQAFPGALLFPTTPGAFDTTHNGGSCDAFVAKLNLTGSALVYSTYIGGGANDWSYALAIDSSGNAYITGFTENFSATLYPTTAGSFDTTPNGASDAFVTKLNSTGSALEYSTFLGGNQGEQGNDVAVDSSGNAFVTGFTTDFATVPFPTTAGAFDTTHNGNNDAFLTKLNSAGSALVFSTFLGAAGDDRGHGVAVDTVGNAYVTGQTGEPFTPFPTTPGAYDTTHNGGQDAFVTKFSLDGSSLLYSTFLGGNGDEIGYGIAVDPAGDAHVTGSVTEGVAPNEFPTTAGAFDTTFNGDVDAFMSKFNETGSVLDYSTYAGGSSFDRGRRIAVLGGNVFITGYTEDGATDYPTTAGAFDTSINSTGIGNGDFFVSKFGTAAATPTPTATPTSTPTNTPTATATATPTPAGGPFSIEKSVIANGGGRSLGDTFILDMTLGEALAGGPAAGGTFRVNSGFWAGESSGLLTAGVEGDVLPRPNGNGTVFSTDVIQMRRYATGLDTPATDPNEFQRADSAPFSTRGDGFINAGDIIQTRRYATGLDPVVPAGGPVEPVAAPGELGDIIDDIYERIFGSELRAGSIVAGAGETLVVPVELTANGIEAGIGFTLEFDASKVSFVSAGLGEAMYYESVLSINANSASEGRIGILFDSPVTFLPSKTPQTVILLTFATARDATGNVVISLSDAVAQRCVVDQFGEAVAVRYVDGGIHIRQSSF
ncbi:MAG: SBBP repeat-containing protein [Pyrinomonadaceae bacterium]